MHLFAYIIIPLIFTNILHMVLVKKDWFRGITIPISTQYLGANKTWRGFVVVPFLNAVITALSAYFFTAYPIGDALLAGWILGFAYVLFELPNSWLKRSIGIESGGSSERFPLLFKAIDKMDSSLGVSLFSTILFELSLYQTSLLFFFSVLTHVFFSWILVVSGIKKSF